MLFRNLIEALIGLASRTIYVLDYLVKKRYSGAREGDLSAQTDPLKSYSRYPKPLCSFWLGENLRKVVDTFRDILREDTAEIGDSEFKLHSWHTRYSLRGN